MFIQRLKSAAFIGLLASLSTAALAIESRREVLTSRAVEIHGVEYSCLGAIRASLIRQVAQDSAGDPSALNEFRSLVRGQPVYLCKAKKLPHVETASWCDGSGCTGAEAHKLRSGQCVVSGQWEGQDDGESVDENEHRKNCIQ